MRALEWGCQVPSVRSPRKSNALPKVPSHSSGDRSRGKAGSEAIRKCCGMIESRADAIHTVVSPTTTREVRTDLQCVLNVTSYPFPSTEQNSQTKNRHSRQRNHNCPGMLTPTVSYFSANCTIDNTDSCDYCFFACSP